MLMILGLKRRSLRQRVRRCATGATQMGVEVARWRGAPVEPVVGAHVAANVACEAFVLVGRGEDEVERVLVGLVVDELRGLTA